MKLDYSLDLGSSSSCAAVLEVFRRNSLGATAFGTFGACRRLLPLPAGAIGSRAVLELLASDVLLGKFLCSRGAHSCKTCSTAGAAEVAA